MAATPGIREFPSYKPSQSPKHSFPLHPHSQPPPHPPSIRLAQRSLLPLQQLGPLSRHAEQQLLYTKHAGQVFLLKLRISTAWNATFFCIQVAFNIFVGVGLWSLKGGLADVCSLNQPAITRALPFIAVVPFASAVMNLCSEAIAALLTLWAMAPTTARRQ
jgi:hypothetical protein